MEALYLEDDVVQQRLMGLYLADMGIKLHLADNGDDGLRIAQKVLPSFILMDMNVPGLSGVTLLRLFREDRRLERTPIVIVTADLLIKEKFNVTQFQSTVCLFKPIHKKLILTIVEQLSI